MSMSKKILIFGASGFIGKALIDTFRKEGHFVVTASRHPKKGELYVDFKGAPKDLTPFENFDLWIHLSGETIQAFRWTKRKKRKILFSRMVSNEILKEMIGCLKKPPKQIMIASGIGYYGSKVFTVADESTKKGEGFLAEVASRLESIWQGSKIQPVFLRFAPVLGQGGGVLSKLRLSYFLKMVIYFGSKENYFPYVYLDDLCKMVSFLIEKESKGPVNICSQSYKTQKEVFNEIAATFRPVISFTIPKIFLRLLMGQFADETLLVNVKVLPKKLIDLGYFNMI